MITKKQLTHYHERIALLSIALAKVQKDLREIKHDLLPTISYQRDIISELESCAHLDSDSGTAICNWTD